MINPFNIHKNKRYTLGGRTVVIEDVLQSNVVWYDLMNGGKYKQKNIHQGKNAKITY